MDDNRRIHILDEATINKIAAGEVIERPASIVKELIENSIDASATDVRVEVRGSGSKLTSVLDNGEGMSREDAEIAFNKHATSKIRNIEDIEEVQTMGFRGEALSSIAAVAHVELVSRKHDALSGVKVQVTGGIVEDVSEIGSSPGTKIVVKDLFYNTPARRKYLKSARTELSHITDTVMRLALANPNVSFTLVSEGRVILRAPAGDIFDRIIQLLGSDIAKTMLPVKYEGELVKVSGFISKPEISRTGKDMQYFFVNGRSIASAAMSNAVLMGYYSLLPKGRQPLAVLNVSVNLKEVDVNVHPAKRHVRFSRESDVMDELTRAVEDALANQELIPEVKLKSSKKAQFQMPLNPEKPMIEAESPAVPVVKESKAAYRASAKDTEKRIRRSERTFLDEAPESIRIALKDMKIIGQVHDLYIIVESEDGLMLIDQHAAHERIMYEQIRRKASSGWQELLEPLTIDLTPREKAIMQEYIPYFEEMGFALSEFGPNTYIITAVPHVFGKVQDPSGIRDMVSEILSTGRIKDKNNIYDHMYKTMACRAAIKAGAPCTIEQMTNLLEQLEKAENPFTCPHGRPTIISLTMDELAKLFKRTG
ncbi:DNA mismatch repair protein MutL [Methanohalophilus levihalophilus]|uniref:DNA mismatch repair endonuclease MutL n=1 Tax=Methanohalophilus levihalophilus TaxID=1431282 RepID=UPI001AE87850|nr:DNA mismatch repair endonuclease MutL [Methanohalophilus levihalophilus]MBP2029893.1 DNA mismatch repair protein MutL [Methanohalophilus levihalophilus]